MDFGFWIDIHGVCFHVAGNDTRLVDFARRVARHFGFDVEDEAPADDAVTITLSVAAPLPPVPDDAVCVDTYDEGVTSWRHASGLYLAHARTLAALPRDAGTARLHVHPQLLEHDAAGRAPLGMLFAMVLLLMLRARGCFSLHAAALVREGRGVLLVAPSDAGKSTLSYSLVRAGWHYLSDDAILLRDAGDHVEALSFRRTFTLDDEAATFFPEIAAHRAHRLPGEEKWAVPMEAAFPGRAADRCVPALLVFPEIGGAAVSRTEAVEKHADALYLTLAQTPFLALEPDRTPRHLDLVRRLVAQTRHVRFVGGRDVLDEPQRASALLAGQLHKAAGSAGGELP